MNGETSASTVAPRTRARAAQPVGESFNGGAWDGESPGAGGGRMAAGLAERAYETRTAASPYLVTEEVAERLRCSIAKVHELTRLRAIPHRRLPGSRRCLFLVADLEAWEAGGELQVRELERGGRVVEVVVQ